MIFRNFPPPPAFTCLLVLALGLIWTFAPPATIPAVCLGPPQLGKGFWRQVASIAVSPLFHAGALHFLMNSLAGVSVLGRIERKIGSLPAAGLVFLLVLPLVGTMQTLFLWLTGLSECSVGFSGALFCFFILEPHLQAASSEPALPQHTANSPATGVSAGSARNSAGRGANIVSFGQLASTPTTDGGSVSETPSDASAPWPPFPQQLIPWLSLLILQVLLPRVSFSSHFAGLLAGHLLAVLLARVPHALEWTLVAAWHVSNALARYCHTSAGPMTRGLDQFLDAVPAGGADLPRPSVSLAPTMETVVWFRHGFKTAYEGAAAALGRPAAAAAAPTGSAGVRLGDPPTPRGTSPSLMAQTSETMRSAWAAATAAAARTWKDFQHWRQGRWRDRPTSEERRPFSTAGDESAWPFGEAEAPDDVPGASMNTIEMASLEAAIGTGSGQTQPSWRISD
ncbi:hypothetical protein H696_05182 [Fonticula alba]|uniref:Peptidase S54 rhomboid domain-containing protein n=1 Tax=Fonticula alba TaxID=691883 RepID=A0A058Z1W1_FONAL|nr:hypothetical protein H696_05182 [Fonticula alba]KCV68260.1 hypothetical protein H696_05182 [Fonticula alba]|eukprot:XP_009497314.1 hypothetical protein H696_05182 [Fonticula alba]